MSLGHEVWIRKNGLCPSCGNDDQYEPVHRCRPPSLYDRYRECSEPTGMARSGAKALAYRIDSSICIDSVVEPAILSAVSEVMDGPLR